MIPFIDASCISAYSKNNILSPRNSLFLLFYVFWQDTNIKVVATLNPILPICKIVEAVVKKISSTFLIFCNLASPRYR
ncbi:hypothetical protein DSUL_40129 [Desulfovibrionales bacterium]